MIAEHLTRSATANSVRPSYQVSAPWIGKHGHEYRTFRVWQTEGWSQSFLQRKDGEIWTTLY